MIRNIRGISAAEVLIPGFAIASLLVMFFNLPGPVMDWLLSFNIALSVLIFLTTFFIRRPLDFSVFPTLLLATTLFRLALNIGTTRLILTRADTSGTLAAGKVVRAFSEFVSADSLVVGFVIGRLTKKGGEKLAEREAEWVRYSAAVNAVLSRAGA